MYRQNKKLLRSARRRYPDSEWKRKYGWSRHSLNDQGVVTWAKKRKHHRRHEIKPYERPRKT